MRASDHEVVGALDGLGVLPQGERLVLEPRGHRSHAIAVFCSGRMARKSHGERFQLTAQFQHSQLGFDRAGAPLTRTPKRRITVRDLMLHTSGHGYEFFYEDGLRFRTAHGIPSIVGASSYESIPSVLLHDPGERCS